MVGALAVRSLWYVGYLESEENRGSQRARGLDALLGEILNNEVRNWSLDWEIVVLISGSLRQG